MSNDHVASIVLHSASQLSGFLVRPTQDHEIGITVNDNGQFREVRRVIEQLTRPGSQHGIRFGVRIRTRGDVNVSNRNWVALGILQKLKNGLDSGVCGMIIN